MSTIEAGMDDVTTKPYRIHDMLRQIETLVNRYPKSESDTENSYSEVWMKNPSHTTDISNPNIHHAQSSNGNASGRNRSTTKSSTTSSTSPSERNRTFGNSSNATRDGD